MQTKAYAKLNLSLNVFPRQGQFHPIDSVAVAVSVFDEVQVTLQQDGVVVKGCPEIPVASNTAYIAALAFCQAFGVDGCKIHIQKRIPVGAGMGGSSADAAAVVRCLCKLCNVDIADKRVENICALVGSDVNFLLKCTAARMTGKGDCLQGFLLPRPIHFAVTTFSAERSSKEVYANFDELGGCNHCNNDKLVELLRQGSVDAFCLFSNGLQLAAQPSDFAEDYLCFCNANGLCYTMTGSGSAFFIPFAEKSHCDAAVRLLTENGFDTFACQTIAGDTQ